MKSLKKFLFNIVLPFVGALFRGKNKFINVIYYHDIVRDKGYSYIKITNEPYRRILPCKQRELDGSEYIGPYTSAYSIEQAIDNIRRIFKLPNCSIKFGNKNFSIFTWHSH